jgi:hypothetical protein
MDEEVIYDVCTACGKDIIGPICKVIDGEVSEDGEFEAQNTETYHPTCITVDW